MKAFRRSQAVLRAGSTVLGSCCLYDGCCSHLVQVSRILCAEMLACISLEATRYPTRLDARSEAILQVVPAPEAPRDKLFMRFL